MTGRPSTRTDRALEVTIDSSLKIGIFPPAAIHMNLMTVFQVQIDGGGNKGEQPRCGFARPIARIHATNMTLRRAVILCLCSLKTSKIPPRCDLMGTTDAYQVVKLLEYHCGCLGKAAPLTTPSAVLCIRLSIILF